MMDNELLRHLIATILYRFEKSVKGREDWTGTIPNGYYRGRFQTF